MKENLEQKGESKAVKINVETFAQLKSLQNKMREDINFAKYISISEVIERILIEYNNKTKNQ